MELNNVFETDIIKEYELNFRKEYLKEHFNIDIEVFETKQVDNVNLYILNDTYEKSYFESQKLSEKD